MNDITTRALVTGGSGGIGGAICRALSAQGHYVYVHAHRGMAAAQSVAAGIIDAGGQASATQFDVTDADATRATSFCRKDPSRFWSTMPACMTMRCFPE